MKKWLCVVAVLVFAGCQKGIEPFTNSGNPGGSDSKSDIVGTWKFISLSGNQKTTTEYMLDDSDYKSVAAAIYTTTDSTGSLTFNADSTYKADSLGYNLSYTTYIYDYTNGVLTDSSQQPATYPLPASNSNGTYELFGSDSIAFTSGDILSTNSPITANGGRYKINGNTLSITEVVAQDTTIDSGGIPLQQIINNTYILTLQKQ